jgi:hypothetical protein
LWLRLQLPYVLPPAAYVWNVLILPQNWSRLLLRQHLLQLLLLLTAGCSAACCT